MVSNTPYFPKKMPIVLIATLATLFIAAGFITTGELLAGNVYRAGGGAGAAPVAPVRRAPAWRRWRRRRAGRARGEAALDAGAVAQAEARSVPAAACRTGSPRRSRLPAGGRA